MTSAISLTRMQWVRSPDGIFAGVCEGIGKQLDMNPWVLRAAWSATVLFFGTGLLFYLIMAFALPRSDKMANALGKRYFGVCSRQNVSAWVQTLFIRLFYVWSANNQFFVF